MEKKPDLGFILRLVTFRKQMKIQEKRREKKRIKHRKKGIGDCGKEKC